MGYTVVLDGSSTPGNNSETKAEREATNQTDAGHHGRREKASRECYSSTKCNIHITSDLNPLDRTCHMASPNPKVARKWTTAPCLENSRNYFTNGINLPYFLLFTFIILIGFLKTLKQNNFFSNSVFVNSIATMRPITTPLFPLNSHSNDPTLTNSDFYLTPRHYPVIRIQYLLYFEYCPSQYPTFMPKEG